MEYTRVTVNIMGNEYVIKGPYSEEYIKAIVEYVDEKLKEASSKLNTYNQVMIAIMAALNIGEEMFKLGDYMNQLEEEKELLKKALEEKEREIEELKERLERNAILLDETKRELNDLMRLFDGRRESGYRVKNR